MKKIIFVLIAVMMLSLLSGCGGTKAFDPSKLTVSDFDQSEVNTLVQLFIKQKTVTDETTEAAIVLDNLTDKEFSFDAGQRLEVMLDGKWYMVPDKMGGAMTMNLLYLPAESSEEIMFDFANYYDKLPQGQYRIVKVLYSDAGDTAVAAAEFGIGR